MRHRSARLPVAVALSPLLALASSCGADPAPAPRPPGPGLSSPLASSSAATPAPVTSAALPSPGKTGAACQSEQPLTQGSCEEGLRCGPMPGGYCFSECGFGESCRPEAKCVPSHKAGGLCLMSCSSDADCREGYRCEGEHGVCVVGNLLSPPPPRCAAGPAPDGAPAARRAFSPPVMLSTGEGRGRYSIEPTAALLPSGDLVVVYAAMTRRSEDNALQITTVKRDGKVEGPRAFGSSKKRHFDPWLASRDGELGLVWLGHDGGGTDRNAEIGFASSTDGVRWTAPRAIHDAKADCATQKPYCLDKPMIAAPRGRRAAWTVLYSGEEVERAIFAEPGESGSFGPAMTVGGGFYGDLREDSDGALHAVWVASDDEARPHLFGDRARRVEYVTSKDGRAWSSPVRVSDASEAIPLHFSNAQVAHDARRKRLHVAYPAGTPDGRWDIVLATSTDGGKSWTRTRVNDDAPCANHMTPRLALDTRSGTVHLVWAENRGGVGRLVYARCETGGKSCSANQAVSDAFADYSFVRHATVWRGEYDALVLDEKRGVLHAVWAQPVDEGGVATTRVFHARASAR